MAFMTLLSRILGLGRDIVSAQRYGTSWQWDAFIYAFTLPMFFRRLVGEGALSSAFIPVYSEVLTTRGREEAFRFANIIATLVTAGLLVFCGVTGLLLNLALGIEGLSPRLHLTIDLLRYFFPYLAFMSLYAHAMGVLNCHKHFLTPALGPLILDIAWIAGVLWVCPRVAGGTLNELSALAWVILFSGLLQFAVEIPPLLKLGYRPRWVWDSMDAGVRKTWNLLLPSIMGFAIVQINILVDMTLGFLIGPGANSSLWYGTRLMQFPLGVFTIALGTALLPTISQHAARKEMEQAKQAISFSLRSLFLIILPCSIGLIVLRTPIVQMLFERGEFDAVSTARSASVLMYFSIGLFAFSGQKILAAGFYSVQDTKTPVKVGVFALISNIIFNLILMQFMAESGLALSTSISGILQFALLAVIFDRRVSNFPFRKIAISFLKILAASVFMGAAAWYLHQYLLTLLPGVTAAARALQVFGAISGAAVIYIVLCLIFRVEEMREAWRFALNRRKK